tara:strand:- start:154 stop:414 length:261 start_codon:yes stop_codon:yes gene_type:complete
MLRGAMMTLLPLIIPVLIYFAWRAVYGTDKMPEWAENVPWISLGTIGLVLAALTLGTWRIMDGAPPGSEYVAPHYEDGRFVPGQFK